MSATLSYDDVEVGAELPGATVPLARVDLVRYAGASGDLNPIHWDPAAAASVGLPGVIAHGMLTMGAAARVLTAWAGDPAAVVEYGTRFSSPVPVPDDGGATVEVTARVAEKLEGRRVRVDLDVRSGGSKVLARARAVVALA